MNKRVPLDIQFLYESLFNEELSGSIIKEDPDNPDPSGMTPEDRSLLIGSGFSDQTIRNWGRLEYDSDGAVPFTLFLPTKLIYYGNSDRTHGGMFKRIQIYLKENNNNKFGYKSEILRGDNGDLQLSSYGDKVYFFDQKDEENLVKSLTPIGKYPNHSTARNDCIQGRCWEEDFIVSFWMTKEQVMKNWSQLERFFVHGLNINVEQFAFEFIDTKKIYPYSEIHGKIGASRSDAEQKAMLAKQHIDPESKKKLAGDEYRSAHMKKHAQGHDFAAQANDKKQTSDGIIKLQSLIKENPDETRLVGGKTVSWYDADAAPFIYNNDLKLFIMGEEGNSIPHSSMLEDLGRIKTKLENEAENGVEPVDYINEPSSKLEPINVNDSTKTISVGDRSMKYYGDVENLIRFLFYNLDEFVYGDVHFARFRDTNKKIGIMGRAWEKSQTISVWKNTNELEKLKSAGILRDIIGYLKYDEKTTNICAGDKYNTVKYTHIDSDETEKAMSDKEYRDLLSKQHVDPESKKKLAGDSYKSSHLKKHAQGHDFAAQANAGKQTSDGIIKLGSLIKEDPDFVHFEGFELSCSTMDAYTFIYSPKYKVYLVGHSKQVYHYHILMALQKLNDDYNEQLKNGKTKSEALSYITDTNSQLPKIDTSKNMIYGRTGDFKYEGNIEDILEYAAITKNFRSTDKIDYRMRVQELGYMGRFWVKHNIISLWTISAFIPKMIANGDLKKIIEYSGLNERYVFIDIADSKMPPTKYTDLLRSHGKNIETVSDKERMALLAKQHIDPEAKRKLAGDEYQSSHLKKLAQGHEFAAAANAKRNVGDGIIRLKDLIR